MTSLKNCGVWYVKLVLAEGEFSTITLIRILCLLLFFFTGYPLDKRWSRTHGHLFSTMTM